MELFKEINYIQNFGKISINRKILEYNPSWKFYIQEIELKDYLNKDVDIYTHDYLDFLGSFQENIIEDYISKKKENQFMTIENYIQRFIWWNISVLENILFSKNRHEEYNDRITQKLELINFPKHFVSISDELIYTIETRGTNEYHYIFLKGFENKDESFQKDYFLNLYKFLSEGLPILLKEIDSKSSPKATQKQNVQKEIGGVIERTLTMKQIALKFVFEKKQITEQNKNNIAANYNWISKNSGEKLKREYDYFQKRNNRIGQIKDQTPKKQKNRIELFESVLSLLEGDTIEIQNEIEILKSKMENDDL